jgi:cytochrome c553
MRTEYSFKLGLALALVASVARAEDTGDAIRQAGARIAITTCANCHGPQGNSISSKFPNLAGQRPNYLEAQLKAFRSQSRGDPDALSYMWGMAAPLSDATIHGVAEYYASQKPGLGKPGAPEAVAKGQDIYKNGVAARGIPACASCHGPNAEGLGEFPRLAGQQSAYLEKQLRSFQSELREMAIMHAVTEHLQPEEMDAVAAYLQSLD